MIRPLVFKRIGVTAEMIEHFIMVNLVMLTYADTNSDESTYL